MILFQHRLDAFQAWNWGLVAYEGEDYRSYAMALTEQAAAVDPMALRLAKKLLSAETHSMQREFEAFTQAFLYEQNFRRVNS
ncbi:hypothetical protein [Pandoraea sp. XY-2]|uniref:hypothetical protein n=1 Tax=Pandoraea sp. XY-2 TaxID=2518599 RepID=UPI00101B151B|nr:hypothetical protein [Pandoraea sp. XY-2]QBC31595.1 hypothetical protein DRB87_09795 [Pandoraea sp. XY-2]